ncbi:MAG: ABC transporter permease [Armatimonadota bacterium]
MNGWLTILRKDLREMWRDRRVIIGVFVMPMFIMVVFVTMFGMIEKKLGAEPDIRIGVVGEASNPLLGRLTKNGKPNEQFVMLNSVEEAKARLEKGDLKLLVEPSPDWDTKVKTGTAVVVLHYDHQAPLSMVAAGLIRRRLDAENLRLAEETLVAAGASRSAARPIKIDEVDTSKAKGIGASSFSGLLPYLIVLFAFTAAASSAADLVAGEKERGTMETLMVSPPKRLALAMGKFGSLCVVSLIGGSVAVVSLVMIGTLKISGSETIFPKGVSIPFDALLVLAGLLIPLSAMYAGVMVAVSAAARSMREAQSYLAVLNLLVMGPAVASQVVGVTGMDKSAWIAWVPVLNTAVGLKGALGGRPDWALFVGSLVTSVAVGAVALALAVKLFQREGFLRRV